MLFEPKERDQVWFKSKGNFSSSFKEWRGWSSHFRARALPTGRGRVCFTSAELGRSSSRSPRPCCSGHLLQISVPAAASLHRAFCRHVGFQWATSKVSLYTTLELRWCWHNHLALRMLVWSTTGKTSASGTLWTIKTRWNTKGKKFGLFITIILFLFPGHF